MTALRMTLDNIAQRERNKLLVLLLIIGSSILLGSFVVLQGSWLTVGAMIVLLLMVLALAWSEAATLAFVFVLYLNIPFLSLFSVITIQRWQTL